MLVTPVLGFASTPHRPLFKTQHPHGLSHRLYWKSKRISQYYILKITKMVGGKTGAPVKLVNPLSY